MKNFREYTASLVIILAGDLGCTVQHCEYYPAHCIDDVGDDDTSSDEEAGSESETGLGTTTETDSTETTETTETSDTGTEPECTQSSECAANEPICVDGLCVPCSEHDQCPDSACNMATGECMATDRVWWVDREAKEGGDGTQAMPYDSVVTALDQINEGEQGVIMLQESTNYGQIKIEKAVDVAILGIDFPVIDSDMDGLVITDGAHVFASQLVITGNHKGISCGGASVWLVDSFVVANDNQGIVGNPCSMHVSRSRIVNNSNAGVVAIAGDVELTNAMVGGSVWDAPALRIDGAVATVVYSTLCGGAFLSPAMTCSGEYLVDVRNSLLVSEQPEEEVVACSNGSVQNSALEMDWGGNNVALGPMDAAWFVDYPYGDLHLSNLAPPAIATAAVWGSGDPKTDIDGESRPGVDGAPDIAGADVAG